MIIGFAAAALALTVCALAVASTHRRRSELRVRILQLASDITEITTGIERDLMALRPSAVSTLLEQNARFAAVASAVLERRSRMRLFSLRRLERGETRLHQAHADVVQLRYRADAALAARRRTIAGELSSS